MLVKYPRTAHLEGSRLQPGDHDLAAVPFRDMAGRFLTIEEKLDGANAAVSFTASGELRLQSRGHYLGGGPRERQFGPFKAWAATVAGALWPRLGDRYVMYGEWLYAKHTVFYDAAALFLRVRRAGPADRRRARSSPRHTGWPGSTCAPGGRSCGTPPTSRAGCVSSASA